MDKEISVNCWFVFHEWSKWSIVSQSGYSYDQQRVCFKCGFTQRRKL